MNRKHGLGNKKWERRTKTHRLEGTRKIQGQVTRTKDWEKRTRKMGTKKPGPKNQHGKKRARKQRLRNLEWPTRK